MRHPRKERSLPGGGIKEVLIKEVTFVIGFEGWIEIQQAERVGVAFQARGLIRQSTVQLGKHRACLGKSYNLG